VGQCTFGNRERAESVSAFALERLDEPLSLFN
jgi:hypothetical protein